MVRLPTPAFRLRANFAFVFKRWRRQQRFTLKQVAAEFGCRLSTVHAWESGVNFPGGAMLDLIIVYTGIPACQLLCGHAAPCDCAVRAW